MSEYQYYEFRAIDRQLTKSEMDELRAVSTRATITPTSFVNVYNYGDFGGSPLDLMERYFDAFVYVANWGTRQFMLRLPQGLVDPETASRYTVEECVQLHTRGNNVILEFMSDQEEPGWEEGEGWLDSLVPLRDDIANGDLRPLYLGWLLAAETVLDDQDLEPPVPPGLSRLSPALQTFVEFLRISDDIIEVAAERSKDMPEMRSSPQDLARWVRDLPDSEKNDLLLRIAQNDDPLVRADILRRFRQTNASSDRFTSSTSAGDRTVAELLSAAEERAEAKRREQAERKARARAAYLDDLATREDSAWHRVETLIEAKRPADYDQAVQLITDLRDISVRKQAPSAFEARLQALRARHAKKAAFLKRLDRVL